MAPLSLVKTTVSFQNTIQEHGLLNTNRPNITHKDPAYAPRIVAKASTQQPAIDAKFQRDLADEGLTWADDPDLPPIPVVEANPKQTVTGQTMPKLSKGLASSRWAGDQGIAEGHKDERPKGLMSSRWANNPQPMVDREMLEHKFKRELSHYGLKNARSGRRTSESSGPAPQPALQPTHQRNPGLVRRPAPQHAPRHNHQHPSRHYSQQTHGSHQGRRWHQNRGSRNTNKPSHQGPSHQGEKKILSLYDPPRLHMDMEEFQREVKQYGLKTLKDSRWADKEEVKEVEEVKETEYKGLRLQMDMEKFEREVKQYGLKTLKDSR